MEALVNMDNNNNNNNTHTRKQKIDKTQQNSECRLCSDSDETIDHISECSKLVQKCIRLDIIA